MSFLPDKRLLTQYIGGYFMKDVARMALEKGMIIGEDIFNYQNELIFPKDTVVDDKVITPSSAFRSRKKSTSPPPTLKKYA